MPVMDSIDEQVNEIVIKDVPRRGWRRVFFKAPLVLWRMGLKFMLPRSFACISTRGKKSGLTRHTMVEYTHYEGAYYIVSGWQAEPQWVKNLLADPHISLEPVGGSLMSGQAQRVQDDLALRHVFYGMSVSPFWGPWLKSLDIAPTLRDFLAKRDRVYVFHIRPTEEAPLPPLAEDLRWLTALVVNALILALIAGIVRSRRKP